MYISRKICLEGYSYRICESFFEEPYYKSRILFDLGNAPQNYITYYSDVSFSIDLEDELARSGCKTNQFELEELFLRFLTPEAQRWVIFSQNRKGTKRISINQDFQVDKLHWFDRIRLITLKLDHREPQRVVNRKFPFFSKLLNKSRDEIENLLWDMEDRLNFREKSRYINAIFGLNRATSLEERDNIFLRILCDLTKDNSYYLDLSETEVLKNYLSRYVWLYFDALSWRRAPRIYQQMEVSLYQELALYLGISVEVLINSSKKEVLKIFRQKILEIHPDKGGSHEEFVKVRRLMEDFIKLRF